MSAIEWTAGVPTEPGHYWIRRHPGYHPMLYAAVAFHDARGGLLFRLETEDVWRELTPEERPDTVEYLRLEPPR